MKMRKFFLLLLMLELLLTKKLSILKNLVISIILTDHHQKPDETTQSRLYCLDQIQICGAVISWVFSKALGSKDKESVANAAVATVTDLQTLTGFNRVIVKKGLEVLNTNPPIRI